MELAGLGSINLTLRRAICQMKHILHAHYICLARDAMVVVIKSRQYELGFLRLGIGFI